MAYQQPVTETSSLVQKEQASSALSERQKAFLRTSAKLGVAIWIVGSFLDLIAEAFVGGSECGEKVHLDKRDLSDPCSGWGGRSGIVSGSLAVAVPFFNGAAYMSMKAYNTAVAFSSARKISNQPKVEAASHPLTSVV